MSAPTLVSTIPDQTDAPGVAITPFDASVYFTDAEESDALTFSLTNFPAGTGLSINSSTGDIDGTPNSNDLAASYTGTVTATDGSSNAASIGIDFAVGDTPSSAANRYIDDATGDDANDGTISSKWKTITRGNQVVKDTTGDMIIHVTPGDYRGQVLRPQNSGDATHRIKWRVNGVGEVNILGPSSGSQEHGIIYDAGIQYVDIEYTSDSQRFVVDGEVAFGTAPGEIQKGDAPESVAKIKKGALFDGGNNCDVGFLVTRTSDWNGVTCRQSGTLRLRLSSEQVGTPFYTDGADRADTYVMLGSGRLIVDGGSLGLGINRGGHSCGICRAGSMTTRLNSYNGIWGGFVPTFSASVPDGNRGPSFATRNSQNCFMYDCALEGCGESADQTDQRSTKLEGRDNVILNTYFREPDYGHIQSACASWSNYAEGLRIGHCVFETSSGPGWEMRDYGSGNNPLGTCELKNCIWIEPGTAADRWLDFVFLTGTWSDQLTSVDGHTIEMASRTFADLEVRLAGGGGPGIISVTTALASHGSVFSNITLTTDADLDSLPAAGTPADPTDLATELALAGTNTDSLENGVNLTAVASSDSGSGTSLVVDDARWFPNPEDGDAESGAFQQYQANVNGTNRTYTAVNYATNTLTMSAGFTRSSGQSVNLRTTSAGNVPSRGYSEQ